jgi:hypothetical protein
MCVRFIIVRKDKKMKDERNSVEILEDALELLKTKTKYPYPRMVGYLMAAVSLTNAKIIARLIEEMKG